MLESDQDRALNTQADARPEVSGQDARAGTTGQNVRYVLVASLVAAILAMIGIAALSTH